jgi:hypothetical protein
VATLCLGAKKKKGFTRQQFNPEFRNMADKKQAPGLSIQQEPFDDETYTTSPITGGVYSSPFQIEGYVNYGNGESKEIVVNFKPFEHPANGETSTQYFSYSFSLPPGPYWGHFAVFWRGDWRDGRRIGWFYSRTPPE